MIFPYFRHILAPLELKTIYIITQTCHELFKNSKKMNTKSTNISCFRQVTCHSPSSTYLTSVKRLVSTRGEKFNKIIPETDKKSSFIRPEYCILVHDEFCLSSLTIYCLQSNCLVSACRLMCSMAVCLRN